MLEPVSEHEHTYISSNKLNLVMGLVVDTVCLCLTEYSASATASVKIEQSSGELYSYSSIGSRVRAYVA